MNKAKLKIDGMNCTSCAILIDGDLEELKGVKKANTNYAKGDLEVEYDSNLITIQKIIQTVKKSGYNVRAD